MIVRRVLYDVVIPLCVGFALVAVGMYFVLQSVPLVQGAVIMTSSGQQVEVVTNHQIFRDVLQTVLAVAALGLAAFGYGAYKLLSSQIEERVRNQTEARYQTTMAYHRVALGYVYWMLYKDPKTQCKTQCEIAEIYLDKAIAHTRSAYFEHVVSLDAKERNVEELICTIRNNWAYYVSEKHERFGTVETSERAECLSFVQWLESKIANHPSQAYDYHDTICTVRDRFSTHQ